MNYKIGDELEVVVTGIREYGAFVTTDDGISGLIHISCIKESLILDVHDHFRTGDIVKAKVVKIDANGKLALSTIGYSLPNYVDENIEDETKHKLYQLKKDLTENNQIAVTEETKAKLYELKGKLTPNNQSNVSGTNIPVEFLEIFSHVEKLLGEPLSERAQQAMKNTIDKYGIFKFTLELAKKQHYMLDKGIAFNDMLEKSLSHEINFNQYRVSDHAIDQWCSERFKDENNREKAIEEILLLVSTGVLFSNRDSHIYIRNGEFIFPCSKELNNTYTVKTVLTLDLYYNQLNQTYKKA